MTFRLTAVLLGGAAAAGIAVTAAAQIGAPQIRADQISAATPQELRVRFPASPQAEPFTPTLRPGGPKNWLKNVKVNEEALLVNKIAAQLPKYFDTSVLGYSITVMAPGGYSKTVVGGPARRAPDGNVRNWAAGDRLSIASVSKPITAAALLRVMAQKNISLDAKISDWLPSDWTFDNGFKQVTIRQLLAHRSGIWDENCGIGFDTLKACAAKSLASKEWHYANTNYALARVMLVKMYGLSPAGGAGYGAEYVTIVNRQVFNTLGLPKVGCVSAQPNPVLSYKSTKDDGTTKGYNAANFDFTAVQPGQDWGDMTAICGSQGWNLSSAELARFAHDLMLGDKLLPQATVDTMRGEGLGLFYYNSNGFEGYGHGGWHPAKSNKGEVNTQIVTFNNGITFGGLFNSRIKNTAVSSFAAAMKAASTAP